MVLAVLIALVGVLAACLTHYYVLYGLQRYYVKCDCCLSVWQAMLALLIIFAVHIVESFYFTGIYWAAHQLLELGEFTKAFKPIFRDYVYHSLVTMTTLGLSEFNPEGHIKFITAMQSLLGFMMLTWSATFYYKLFSQEIPNKKSN